MTRHTLSAGWAWRPDDTTVRALARGKRKVKAFEERRHNDIMGETEMATSKASAKKGSVKKGSAKKARKVTKKTTTAAPETPKGHISLKELLGKKMDPKIARRKLRAAELAGHDEKSRWTFSPKQAEKAREVLGL